MKIVSKEAFYTMVSVRNLVKFGFKDFHKNDICSSVNVLHIVIYL